MINMSRNLLEKKCVVAITIAERVFIGPRFNLFFRRLLLDIQLVCRIYFHKYWIIPPIFMSFENVFVDINLQVDVRNDKCVYVCKPISKHTLFIHSLFYFSFSLVVVLNFDDLFIFNFKSRLLFISPLFSWILIQSKCSIKNGTHWWFKWKIFR